jgi:perosamine synthetase
MNDLIWPTWPQYGEAEQLAVSRVIKSNQIFAADEVRNFEKRFAEFTGVRYAIGVGNATQGLHLALAVLGVGVDNEVIVTPYTWISSASCILMQNAVPVFADCENETLGICPKSVEENITTHTKAIIVVHMFGYPAKIDQIVALGRKYSIPVIEDASHAPGALLNGKPIGSFGDIAVFSLHQRKAISVGDGGIIVTNSEKLAGKLRRLRSFGDDELSYNYRMTEFAGALGTVGLGKLAEQNRIRITNAALLTELLKQNPAIRVRNPALNSVGVFYSVLLEVEDHLKNDVDQLISLANERGLPIKRTWTPLHRHPHFNPIEIPARGLPWKSITYTGNYYKNKNPAQYIFPIAEQYCDYKILELVIHPPVGEIEIAKAVSIINDIFR